MPSKSWNPLPLRKACRVPFSGHPNFLTRRPQVSQCDAGSVVKKVAELGELGTIRSMINPQADGPNAVEFGISLGERPFTESGLSSTHMFDSVAACPFR